MGTSDVTLQTGGNRLSGPVVTTTVTVDNESDDSDDESDYSDDTGEEELLDVTRKYSFIADDVIDPTGKCTPSCRVGFSTGK